MRTNCLYVLVFLVASTSLAKGQAIVKTNVLAPIVGGASLAVEWEPHDVMSIVLNASFGNTPLLGNYDQYTFQSLQTQLRVYGQSSKPMRGRYISPYIKYMHRQLYRKEVSSILPFVSKSYRNFDGHSIGMGIGIGRQGILTRRLVMDISAGAGFLFYASQQEQRGSSDQIGHVDVNLTVSLGFLTGRINQPGNQ